MDVVADAKRDPRGQGERGENLAAAWYIEQGAVVLVPMLYTPRDYDFIVSWEDGSDPQRIQVKTSTVFLKGRWDVALCTRGGNRSWSGLVKQLDPSKYDGLFVDRRRTGGGG